jgi:hypothetical protein
VAGVAIAFAFVSSSTVLAETTFKAPILPFARGLEMPGVDRGDSASVEAVKAAVIDGFEKLEKLSKIPSSTQKAIGDGTAERASDYLFATLSSVWVPSKADEYYEDFKSLLQVEDGRFPAPDWNDVELVIDQWQGVQVDTERGSALFIGHFEYTSESEVWSDETIQWKVELQQPSGSNAWFFSERIGHLING